MLFLLTSALLYLALSGTALSDVTANSPDHARLRSYHNPIVSGFAPDPSCTRVGEQFFCVSSSFSAFPGIPVYTSRDLVQFQQIGNVLSRPEQLPTLNTINTPTGGIWACTIRHREGTFYVTTTLVMDSEPEDSPALWDNLLFTTKDIFANNGNGWSDPVHFSFQGYDTSLFWDDDGTPYIQGSHYWRIFPGIQLFAIDLATGESVSGEPVTLWAGTGGEAPEGPHIYRRDDGYYLLVAEGGTGLGHMVTMARSPNVTGPYTSYANNPVMTNANTSLYLQTLGHADVFNDTAGNWWSVALATRNGIVNFPMGRETVLVPVVWEEGRLRYSNLSVRTYVYLHPTSEPVYSIICPLKPTNHDVTDPLVGHSQHITFPSTPNASLSELPRQLVYYRFPYFSRFTVSPEGYPNTLRIMGSTENITGNGGVGTSTFISRRQDAVEFTAESTLEFAPDLSDSDVESEEAGMTLFIQRMQHFDMGVVVERNVSDSSRLQKFIQLKTIDVNASAGGLSDVYSRPGLFPLTDDVEKLRLRVQAVNASTYVFSYIELKNGTMANENNWTIVGYGAAREVSGGFTGTLVGMYATGNGHNSITPAYFSDFTYDPVQGVF
ncbi:uncharacterized protein FOMMEDRAFT_101567 [Fomitiporia mediterranea MF3/22]|uniref:uncharacterized protein n=1 Tax=Fomitiporia mediterranea (strain MF3/22) TaxID=694068 RepID=UPI0004407E77|nr:uncharacterized protein FOMMEDRAFT_101567 [Fomitiporia mediterranea MF3/22]EJD08131.1 hypothetical protein FOMMEDRAFT_101567 [Fomitiporia mediterranea MF3/22]